MTKADRKLFHQTSLETISKLIPNLQNDFSAVSGEYKDIANDYLNLFEYYHDTDKVDKIKVVTQKSAFCQCNFLIVLLKWLTDLTKNIFKENIQSVNLWVSKLSNLANNSSNQAKLKPYFAENLPTQPDLPPPNFPENAYQRPMTQERNRRDKVLNITSSKLYFNCPEKSKQKPSTLH